MLIHYLDHQYSGIMHNVEIGRWIEEHVLYKQRIGLRWIGGECNRIVGLIVRWILDDAATLRGQVQILFCYIFKKLICC